MGNVCIIRSVLLSVFLVFFIPVHAVAEWQPDGPITFEVGFAAGGNADVIARTVASAIEETRGWQIVVENRPGGGGAVMAGGLVRKPANGRVVGVAVSEPLIVNLATRDDVPFDLESFDYLATATSAVTAFVARGDAPFDDVQGFIDFAKENGGATFSVTSRAPEMIMRAIARESGAPIRTMPTRGGAESLQQIIGGHVDAGFDGGAHIRYLESGELKVLAPATTGRHPVVSDVPTLAEQGYDHHIEPFFFFLAPRGLPEDVSMTLAAALDEAIKSPKVVELLEDRLRGSARNLGPDGTREMMFTALENLNDLLKTAE